MGDHTAPEATPDVIPAPARRWAYVGAVVVTAATWTLQGLGVLTGEQAAAITGGLTILSSGLALGYVPRTAATPEA